MQILPGSSDNVHAYKCITGDLQYDNRVSARESDLVCLQCPEPPADSADGLFSNMTRKQRPT